MFGQFLVDGHASGAADAIVEPEREVTWAELEECSRAIRHAYGHAIAGRRIGLSFLPVAASYATLAAMDALAGDAFLLDSTLSLEASLALAERLRLCALLVPTTSLCEPFLEVHSLHHEEKGTGNSTVTILTSGSTGEPKAVRHSWKSLSRPIRTRSMEVTPKWLLAYRPHLYAGLQVALQCFADNGTLVIPSAQMSPGAIANFMAATGVQYASATPSYWRRLILFADKETLTSVPLVQVTLGGEVVDQPMLDSLKSLFPKARIVHIYATTEFGRCFSVHDGLAGFPASYLNCLLPDGVELTVSGNELLVRSGNSSASNLSHDFAATGDLVEVREQRVCFVGRTSEIINVAGSKVHPAEVERIIRTVDGVSNVRVFGKVSSIAGELVACEIVPAYSQDREALRQAVAAACQSGLAGYQRPRSITFVDDINLSSAGKTVRRKVS